MPAIRVKVDQVIEYVDRRGGHRERDRAEGPVDDRSHVEPMRSKGRHKQQGVLGPLMDAQELQPSTKAPVWGSSTTAFGSNALRAAFTEGEGSTASLWFALDQTARSALSFPM